MFIIFRKYKNQFLMIDIKIIKAEETYAIRKEVLRKNIELPFIFKGDLDKDTFHLGILLDHKLIGIVSFMKSVCKDLKGNQYQLRGMATLDQFQGKGYGQQLIKFGSEVLKEKQMGLVWCNARVVAVNFYKKAGFKIIGKEFYIPKIGDHFVMFKKLG